jgi:predicted enzyme related to lactoylglutathione lyase
MATPFETPGAFSWLELLTTDPKAARDFYGKLFDWQYKDMDMGPSGTYTVVNAPGTDNGIGGITAIPPKGKGMPPMWGAYVTVTDVDKVVAKVTGLGGQVLMPPTDIPTVGRFATIRDPQGAMLSLITYAPRT